MKKCKNCQFFDNKVYKENPRPKRGICSLYAEEIYQENDNFIHPFYTDDSDIFEFTVGEEFGCVHWKLRQVDPNTGIKLNNN
jgi:hypothetical protein